MAQPVIPSHSQTIFSASQSSAYRFVLYSENRSNKEKKDTYIRMHHLISVPKSMAFPYGNIRLVYSTTTLSTLAHTHTGHSRQQSARRTMSRQSDELWRNVRLYWEWHWQHSGLVRALFFASIRTCHNSHNLFFSLSFLYTITSWMGGGRITTTTKNQIGMQWQQKITEEKKMRI